MRIWMKKSGFSLIAATVAILCLVAVLTSHGPSRFDIEVQYESAVDCILLGEYDEAADLLQDTRGYADSDLLLEYLQCKASYVVGVRESAVEYLRALYDLQSRYDGVLSPVLRSEADAVKRLCVA